MTTHYQLFFDGSSLGQGRRGGPGPSAGAAVLIDENGVLHATSLYLAKADSDIAEYTGLLCGLETAWQRGATSLLIKGDSRNTIDQILGKKTVSKSSLVELRNRALDLLTHFPHWQILWIARKHNKLADGEARLCLTRFANHDQ